MGAQTRVRTIIARLGEPQNPPFAAQDPQQGQGPGAGSGAARNIPANHEYDPKALKPLARALFSASVALGHTITAYREFARIKSASISPDGMLGGRGYVLDVKEVRSFLQSACEMLSSVTDTLHDEVRAPHWQPKLGELGANDAEDIKELMSESEEAIDNPEAVGDKSLSGVEDKNDGPNGTSNSTKWKDTSEGASEVPGGGDPQQGTSPRPFGQNSKEAAVRTANSSVPVDTLPGPRVNHLDRGEQTGPGGSYNRDEPPVEDAWGLPGERGYDYETEWSNSLSEKSSETSLPDGKNDGTETDANDFGLGFGAKGKGSEGYGVTAPDGHGVFGPSSDLPQDPGGKTKDPESGSPYLDGADRNLWACSCPGSELPFDGPDSVARADYYEGDKGNLVNAPLHSGAGSELPGTPSASWNYDSDLPNVGYNYERGDTNYVKYDTLEDDSRYDRTDANG